MSPAPDMQMGPGAFRKMVQQGASPNGRRHKVRGGAWRLRDIVESGPVAHGLQTGIWTSINLAEIIAEEFGVVYHPGHVRKLLRQIGLSVQRPTTRLIQADPALQRKWTRYTVPNLKKKPSRNMP